MRGRFDDHCGSIVSVGSLPCDRFWARLIEGYGQGFAGNALGVGSSCASDGRYDTMLKFAAVTVPAVAPFSQIAVSLST